MSYLSRLFNKRGIKDVNELSQEERQTFERWDKILSEGEITVDKIAKFCESKKKIIESQWRDISNDPKKNERLIVYHNVYSAILEAIHAPTAEREQLEQYLQQLLDEK